MQRNSKLKLLSNLLRQLADYGLNPGEWQIKAHAGQETIRLQHRHDSNFQLTGAYALEGSKRAYWRALYLTSL